MYIYLLTYLIAAVGVETPLIVELFKELLELCLKSKPFSILPAPAGKFVVDAIRFIRSWPAVATPEGTREVLEDVVPDIEVVAAVANEAAVAADAVVNVGVEFMVEVVAWMAEVVVLLLPPVVTVIFSFNCIVF